jgi:bifunctional non-homologous end joining protein LigD
MSMGRDPSAEPFDLDRFPVIRPMVAVLGDALPDDDAAWGYEFKWDGVRAVSYLAGDRIRLLSRNDRDITASYPEVLPPLRDVRDPVVLDGELVAFVDGRPSFAELQRRMHVWRPDSGLIAATPVTYLVFDVLQMGDHSTLRLPYARRRDLVTELDLDRDGTQRVAVPPAYAGGGADVLRASEQAALEGVIAKRLDSTYQPGRRSPVWMKIKNLRTQEVVIGGWTPGKGRRTDRIGSLLLGLPTAGFEGGEHDEGGEAGEPAGLAYCGQVGTGFTELMLDELRERLRPLERRTSPFVVPPPAMHARTARWVQPELVGEVRFTEWTGDGRLRHPAWRGLRPDKSPAEVVKETVHHISG